jgi:ubiquinone/menaquinone biosynthesis C-methylase UbiE
MCETSYALGHSSAEVQRLKNQGAMLRQITERLLRSAEIDAGGLVLDLGCGAGDVSMLAAELVGPAGFVVGIDRSQEVLEVARKGAQEAGLRQISFVRASVEEFSVDEPFDLGEHFSEAGLPYPHQFSGTSRGRRGFTSLWCTR